MYKWLLDGRQQREYPILSKWAVNIHSIPAMAAEPERVFSGTKRIITDSQHSLGSDTIQVLQCLRSSQATEGVRSI